MRGVDVGAHPQAGVGEAHARRRGPLGQALDHRRGLCRLDQLLQAERLGLGQLGAQRQPRLDQRVVVVAGDEHELACPRARARAPRRTAAPPRALRAAGRGAARARRRAAPRDRRRRRLRSSGSRSSGRRSRSERETPPRCRSERISVRIARLLARDADGGARAGSPGAAGAALSFPRRRPPASRIVLGSMKRTSSRITWNSEMSVTPRSRNNWTSSCTRFSGALAPEEMPTTRAPASHSSRISLGGVDQVRLGAAVARDLDQAHGVRRVARADHEQQVAAVGHLLDGRLAVGRGVADVVGARTDDLREALAQPRRGSRSFRRRRASSG